MRRAVLASALLIVCVAVPLVAWALPQKGDRIAGFTLARLGGGPRHSLDSFKGKVVLLNFWASWCPGCKAEFPELVKIREAYARRGFELIAINVDKVESEGVKALNAIEIKSGLKVSFPVLYDAGQTRARELGLPGLPVSILIGPDGRVIELYMGEIKGRALDKLRRDVEAALPARGTK